MFSQNCFLPLIGLTVLLIPDSSLSATLSLPELQNSNNTFDQAIQVAQALKNKYSQADVIARIASKLISAGQTERALRLLTQALEIVKVP